MQNLIPLYNADGELQCWLSQQRMARLDGLGLIRIVRHKKGRVSRCIMHRRPGDPLPVKLSVYLGTRYSYLERLDSGRLVWTLRKLRQTGAPCWPTLASEEKAAIVPRPC